ncbi:MAG: hypothetical protein JSV18_07410 [Candidatus Bathyarchaeota archaeon]|nr:MAG: hypothetical protein JSV18_07410 [Candidatus Bathyarchaeota archaeon]
MTVLEAYYRPVTALGLILIVSGLILVLLPFIARSLPDLDKLPWILVWVYRRDGFYFVTSPLLIILSIVSIILNLFGRRPLR